MAKRNTRHRRHRRKNMRGGAFSPAQIQRLNERGLANDQIERLQELGISFEQVMEAITRVMDRTSDGFNSDDMAQQVMVELTNTNNAPINVINENPIEDADISFETQGPMTSDELNTSNDTDTTEEDRTGGKKYKKKSRKGYLKRKEKKSRKTRKHKQRGGTCYGSGVGANRYDPNFSIYNTNMLKLFPYRSN